MTETLEAQEVHPLTFEAEVQKAIVKAMKGMPLSDNVSRDAVIDLFLDLSADVKALALAAA